MPGDTIEAYPHHVKVTVDGTVLAETTSGLLHRHSYAPDIYIPLVDVRTELLHRNGDDFAARLAGATIEAIAKARPDLPALGGRITFDFNKIRLDVDGSQVRGHVRDPHKVITVAPVPGHLQMMLGEHAVVYGKHALAVPIRDAVTAVVRESDRGGVVDVPDPRLELCLGLLRRQPRVRRPTAVDVLCPRPFAQAIDLWSEKPCCFFDEPSKKVGLDYQGHRNRQHQYQQLRCSSCQVFAGGCCWSGNCLGGGCHGGECHGFFRSCL